MIKTWWQLLMLVCLISVSSCQPGEKNFEWPEDIAELTGKNLGEWLRQAPFSNELVQDQEGKVVYTNAKQVFPFMGRYKNATEELIESAQVPDDPIYQQETVLYQDPEWGDLFIHAALLYEDQNVFLDRFYRESGNLMFGGVDAAMSSHSATLVETSVAAGWNESNPDYKTAIYWAGTAQGSYLLGFYQQGKLLFETIIPLQGTDTLATLAKLKEVNQSLGLQIAEWEGAAVAELKTRESDDTFWKNPYTGIYFDKEYFISRVKLKTKDTPLQLAKEPLAGDYYFSYDGAKGPVSMYTELKQSDQDEEAFNAAHKDLQLYESKGKKLFYEESPAKGQITGLAQIYMRDGDYLQIHFSYPQDDEKAKAVIHGVLQHVKTSITI